MKVNGLVMDTETGCWLDGDTREVVWITKDDRQMRLSEMETRHIRNCVANILIKSGRWRGGYYKPLVEELKRRNNE